MRAISSGKVFDCGEKKDYEKQPRNVASSIRRELAELRSKGAHTSNPSCTRAC